MRWQGQGLIHISLALKDLEQIGANVSIILQEPFNIMVEGNAGARDPGHFRDQRQGQGL